jgi:RHS repeat-associated protein
MNPWPPEQNRAIACTLLAVDRQRSPLHAFTAAQQQALAFTAYGTSTPQDSPMTVLGFTGERRITGTGHYLLGNGYRAFNPVLMRFNGPDALSPFGRGGLNSYSYCSGDPVNRVDPGGKFWKFLRNTITAWVMGPGLGRRTSSTASLSGVSNTSTPRGSVSSWSGSQGSLDLDVDSRSFRSFVRSNSQASAPGSQRSSTSSFRAQVADAGAGFEDMWFGDFNTPSSGRSRSGSVSSQGSVFYDDANQQAQYFRPLRDEVHAEPPPDYRARGALPANQVNAPPPYQERYLGGAAPPGYYTGMLYQAPAPAYRERDRIRWIWRRHSR